MSTVVPVPELNKENRFVSTFWLLLPYILLVLFHAAFGILRNRPLIFCDELGYLGNARYLAGVADIPDLRQCAFYHFGYSLFIVPAFWFFSDPEKTYQCVMIINAVLISTLYFPVYYIIRRLFQNTEKNSILIAFVSCLYPAFLLQSDFAWSENAFLPVYGCAVAFLVAFLKKPSWFTAALFGFASAFTYTIHPRALSTVPFTVLFLIAIGWFKVIPRSKAFVSLLAVVLTFVATSLINAQIGSAGWGSDRPIPYSFSKMLLLLMTPEGLKNYALLLSGQILYLLQSSYGLFFLGAIFISHLIWKQRHPSLMETVRDHRVITLMFLVFTFLLALLSMNIAFQSSFQHRSMRGDHLMYGRYNEGYLPLYLAIALHALQAGFFKTVGSYKIALAFIILVFALTAVIQVQRSNELENAPYQMANIAGIFPVIRESKRVNLDTDSGIDSFAVGKFGLTIVSGIACLLFVVLQQLFRKDFRSGIALLVLAFLSVGFYNLRRVPGINTKRSPPILPSYVQKLGPVTELSYDLTFRKHYFLYQYLMRDTKFHSFWSERGEKPKTEVVISGRSWAGAKDLNARLLVKEHLADQVLWLLPGRITLADKFSYFNRNLVLVNAPGVSLTGFYTTDAKRTGRWTNGKGRLEIPVDPRDYPAQIEIKAAARQPMHVDIIINGQTVLSEKQHGAWTKTLRIRELSSTRLLAIELFSETFVPKLVNSRSNDSRTLGIFVNSIVLLGNGPGKMNESK